MPDKARQMLDATAGTLGALCRRLLEVPAGPQTLEHGQPMLEVIAIARDLQDRLLRLQGENPDPSTVAVGDLVADILTFESKLDALVLADSK